MKFDIPFMKSYTVTLSTKDLDNRTILIRSNSDYRDEIIIRYNDDIHNTLNQSIKTLKTLHIKPIFFTEDKGNLIILTKYTINKLNGGKNVIG